MIRVDLLDLLVLPDPKEVPAERRERLEFKDLPDLLVLADSRDLLVPLDPLEILALLELPVLSELLELPGMTGLWDLKVSKELPD